MLSLCVLGEIYPLTLSGDHYPFQKSKSRFIPNTSSVTKSPINFKQYVVY